MSEETKKRTRIAKPKSATRQASDIMDWLSDADDREDAAVVKSEQIVRARYARMRAEKVQGLPEDVQEALHALQGVTEDE